MCLEDFLAGPGRSVRPDVIPVPYSTLFRVRELPRGTYVFADLERLCGLELERAAWVWRQLASHGSGVRLLNHPTRVKQRFELLRTLHEHGLNGFNVYRLDEGRTPKRFPVFVRSERQHNKTASGLLDERALKVFLESWRAQGQSLEDTIVTEFCGEPDRRGLYRRYAAFKIGERILPVDILFSRDWEVRGLGQELVVDEETLAEERRFLHDHPHEAQLREVFELAHIDYGRVDYALVNGRVQVYEINTNPYVAARPLGGERRQAPYHHFTREFVCALQALRGPDGGAPLTIEPFPRSGGDEELRRWGKQALYGALWRSGSQEAYARRLRLVRRLVQRGKGLLGVR